MALYVTNLDLILEPLKDLKIQQNIPQHNTAERRQTDILNRNKLLFTSC